MARVGNVFAKQVLIMQQSNMCENSGRAATPLCRRLCLFMILDNRMKWII